MEVVSSSRYCAPLRDIGDTLFAIAQTTRITAERNAPPGRAALRRPGRDMLLHRRSAVLVLSQRQETGGGLIRPPMVSSQTGMEFLMSKTEQTQQAGPGRCARLAWLAAIAFIASTFLGMPLHAQTHQHGATTETAQATQATPAATSTDTTPAATV